MVCWTRSNRRAVSEGPDQGALQHDDTGISLQGPQPLCSLRPIEQDVPLHGLDHISIKVIGIHPAGALHLHGVPDGSEARGCKALQDLDAVNLC